MGFTGYEVEAKSIIGLTLGQPGCGIKTKANQLSNIYQVVHTKPKCDTKFIEPK